MLVEMQKRESKMQAEMRVETQTCNLKREHESKCEHVSRYVNTRVETLTRVEKRTRVKT